MVIWLVGMSGAGKSTIGTALYELMSLEKSNTVLVDGDRMRSIFQETNNKDPYSKISRRRNAERIRDLCFWLDEQNINVICCILCIFPDILLTNKHLYSNYYEVFIDIPMKELQRRDPKGLYAAARRGEIDNLVGVHIEFPRPTEPNCVIGMNDLGSTNIVATTLLENIKPILI